MKITKFYNILRPSILVSSRNGPIKANLAEGFYFLALDIRITAMPNHRETRAFNWRK